MVVNALSSDFNDFEMPRRLIQIRRSFQCHVPTFKLTLYRLDRHYPLQPFRRKALSATINKHKMKDSEEFDVIKVQLEARYNKTHLANRCIVSV